MRVDVGELPGARVRRLERALGFELAVGLVTNGRDRLYEQLVAADNLDPRVVANAVMNEIAGVEPQPAKVPELARIIRERKRLPRDVYAAAIAASANDPQFTADAYLEQTAISDAAELEPLVEKILEANPGQVAAYRGGKEGLLGFFVGQVMKETQGKADPKAVNELLREKLRG
jgi:aspartyl-tRNA(Asn)/glutamyl-tRNA(Gln) amidotransferase subunit B